MHHSHDGSFGGYSFARLQCADIGDTLGDEVWAGGTPAGRPYLKHITIRLRPDAFQHDDETRLQVAMQALAEALACTDDGVPPAWRICALLGEAPLTYEMFPLPGWRVSSEAGWELTSALRIQPQIAAAEPAFEIE